MANARKRNPLLFAYVHLNLIDEEDERPGIYKVFYADEHKIRVRHIIERDGAEEEGANLWIPWTSILWLREK